MMAREKKAHVWPRDPHDWYQEDRAAVDFLLDREAFDGIAWDPACGEGNIVKACLDRDIAAFGTDLIRRTYHSPAWFVGALDFLDRAKDLARRDHIICNPPFGHAKLAEAFIRRALGLSELRSVAMLVNGKFLFGKGRGAGLFAELPPSRMHFIWPRPSMPPGGYDGPRMGGTEDFAWLVWDAQGRGRTLAGW